MSRRWIERGEPFAHLFGEFARSAWRWECQGEYREPAESEPFRLWRAGRGDDTWLRPWADQVRAYRRAGKTFQRARMLTEPPTEYLRWMLDVTRLNVEAGEDIRWIDERRARAMDAPRDDFYLFDDDRVAVLKFDERGVSGAELIDDPDVVGEYRAWRDRVWPVAVPHARYIAGLAERSP